MESSFYTQIENSTAHRKSRDNICELAMSNSDNLKELFAFAFNLTNKNHFKACWALELVLEKNLEFIIPYLDVFTNTVSVYKNDSAVRPISKICFFISKSKSINLSKKQEQQLIETCLDWLIQNEKVATKAYAIRALHNFSKKQPWIKEELKVILEQDYSSHSAAYKAVAREILKKLNK
ncbi:hypothetical protein FIA58_010095 [Flavobacterium jejuense]|uniref:Adenylosuccinate lyase n=1 Tax=Flavobacterium jejuense TaxID=1544455 RepID=A0ABX0IW74_9FLAO|nr:hypothetical protein [Flavobacterium jejuense]NHN26025.1 hypothetical protein [Flavobacterium jejuense]